jgi:hypothetical protein
MGGMDMARKKFNKQSVPVKRTFEEAVKNFNQYCEKCKEPLEVIKFIQGNHKHQEVISATCFNRNFKDLGCKCEQYGIEIRFRYCRWF